MYYVVVGNPGPCYNQTKINLFMETTLVQIKHS